jgi:DNA primase
MTAEETEITRLRTLAIAGAGALRTGQQWEAWLHRAERFADLGFVNTMLIWSQRPDAILLRNYAQWQRSGRQVNRGERGIRLIVSADGRPADRHDHVTTVFDLMQTNGEPQPVRLEMRKYGGKPRAESWQALARLALPGIADGDAVGEWVGWFIATHGGGDEPVAALKLVRQVARSLLRTEDTERGLVGRLEAESVAFLIALRLGLDTREFTVPAVESWAGTDPRAPVAATVASCGERILAAAREAFASIDTSCGRDSLLVTGPRLATKEQATRPVPSSAPILEAARRFFVERMDGSWVPGYLAGRGFGDEVQQRWGIGYAPGEWTALTDYLWKLGYGDDEIEASGLAARCSRGTLIDVFRDRAVFPVRSVDGAVVGFLGRAAPGAGKDVPKYVNTRETELYHKGRVLFGLHEGCSLLSSGARPVIVEGPLDAIAVTVEGDGRYVGVASCGTALTTDQVALLQRFTKPDSGAPIVAFDGDEAGQKAGVRAFELLRGHPGEPMIVEFPDGLDPAECFEARGAEVLLQVLDTRQRPLADVVVDAKVAAFGHWLDFLEGKFNALHAVAPLVAQMPADGVARQVARVADRLRLTHAEVTAAVTDALGHTSNFGRRPASNQRSPIRRPANSERVSRRAG